MEKRKFQLVCIILLLSSVTCTCPEGCTCTAKSVVCSCVDAPWLQAQPQTLTLTALSQHLEYMDLFVIHSCDRVTITNDTFADVNVIEHFKLLNIKLIEILSFAFRGIKKSPKQFLIQDSHIRTIPENAFNGLSGIDHFWFKNVTINKIEPHAFANLVDVKYVYFRHAQIATVDRAAFGRMKRINYFFMRGNVTVGSIDDFVFRGSYIDELVFDDADIKASDYALVGMHATSVEIINSKWHMFKSAKQKTVTQRVITFHVKNSTFNRLMPSLLYDYDSFTCDGCLIHHIVSQQSASTNVKELVISNSRIGQWHAHAFSEGSQIDNFMLNNVTIDKINYRAIFSAVIKNFEWESCTISLTSKKMFEKTKVAKFILTETTFNSLSNSSFGGINVDMFIFRECQVKKNDDFSFSQIRAKQMQVIGSRFFTFPSFMFDRSNITDLTILSNEFSGPPSPMVFSGLYAQSVRCTHNEIVCNPEDCETNSLFFQPSINHLAWQFEHNRCISAGGLQPLAISDLCLNATTMKIMGGSLICQRRLEIEECVCTEPMDVVVLPVSSASIFTLGDCKQVALTDNESTHLHSIYLYRLDKLIVQALPINVKRFHVLHSTVYFDKAFTFAQTKVREIIFNNAVIQKIQEFAFANSYIDTLLITGSKLGMVHPRAFFNSHIDNLILQSCDVASTGDLFDHTKSASITQNKLRLPMDLSKITDVCFMRNFIECRCFNASFNVHHNRCDGSTNQCLNDSSSDIWRTTRTADYEKLCSFTRENGQLRVLRSSSVMPPPTCLTLLLGIIAVSLCASW